MAKHNSHNTYDWKFYNLLNFSEPLNRYNVYSVVDLRIFIVDKVSHKLLYIFL